MFYNSPGGQQDAEAVAVAWSGRVVRTIGLPLGIYAGVRPSPDGSRVIVGSASPPPPSAPVLDDRGHKVASISGYFAPSSAWAEDNRHLCTLMDTFFKPAPPSGYPKPPPPGLYEVSLDGRSRLLATMAEVPPGAVVVNCSIQQNEVTLLARGVDVGLEPTSLAVYRLSDGKLMRSASSTTSPPLCTLPAVFSGDGRVAAETVGSASVVCQRSTDAVIGRVPGRAAGLSWDGSLVLTELFDGGRRTFEVVEWRTGRVLLSRPGSGPPGASLAAIADWFAQPGGDGVVLSVRNERAAGSQIWLVSPRHAPVAVVKDAYPLSRSPW